MNRRKDSSWKRYLSLFLISLIITPPQTPLAGPAFARVAPAYAPLAQTTASPQSEASRVTPQAPQAVLETRPSVSGMLSLPRFATGIQAAIAAAGDVTGDGMADLVTAGDRAVSVLVRQPDGLAPPFVFAGPEQPAAIAIADFNRDGRNDLVIAAASGSAYILINSAATEFSLTQTLTAGRRPSSLVAADFNHDGNPDLAVANRDGNDVSILLANPDGTFAGALSVPAGAAPMSIVAADFNRDGWMDLMTADSGNAAITLLRGNGRGEFGYVGQFPAGDKPEQVLTADFNEDGDMDLAVWSRGDNMARILMNDGAGRFTNGAVFFNVGAMAIGDPEGAGHVGLITYASNTLRLTNHRSAGNGTFIEGISTAYEASLLRLIGGNVDVAALDSQGTVSLFGFRGSMNAPPPSVVEMPAAAAKAPSYDQAGTFAITGSSLSLTASPGAPLFGAVGYGTGNGINVLQSFGGTRTTLTSSANPSSYGQTITLTATVSPAIATGTVTFKDGATSLGTATLDSSGRATLAVPTLYVGSHSLTARYNGDASYLSSTSDVLTQTVTSLSTVISVAAGDTAGLIEAINALNAGGGTIQLGAGATYTFTQPSDWWYGPNALPAISSEITIEGNGATIQRLSTGPKFRFFFVSGGFSTLPPGILTLKNLRLRGGLAQGGSGGGGRASGGGAGLGGAIFNQGLTVLTAVELIQNTAA